MAFPLKAGTEHTKIQLVGSQPINVHPKSSGDRRGADTNWRLCITILTLDGMNQLAFWFQATHGSRTWERASFMSLTKNRHALMSETAYLTLSKSDVTGIPRNHDADLVDLLVDFPVHHYADTVV